MQISYDDIKGHIDNSKPEDMKDLVLRMARWQTIAVAVSLVAVLGLASVFSLLNEGNVKTMILIFGILVSGVALGIYIGCALSKLIFSQIVERRLSQELKDSARG